jgi:hypothetical protein
VRGEALYSAGLSEPPGGVRQHGFVGHP